MSVYDRFEEGDWDEERQQPRRGRKYTRPMGLNAPHYPNKAERRELARIMQKSGMTEDEVRQNVVHRRALAAAAKQPEQEGQINMPRVELFIRRQRRALAHHLKVPVFDPAVDVELDKKMWKGITWRQYAAFRAGVPLRQVTTIELPK